MKFLESMRGLSFALFHRTQIEEEMEEELRAHIQNRADDLERCGLSRLEAERRARIEFGGHQKFKEECREAIGTHLLDTFDQDIRYGVRMLRKNPGLTLVAVLTLTLGIGATTAIFSVVNAVLLRPLPYKGPDRVVMIYNTNPKHPAIRLNPSPGDCLDWKAQNRVFSDLAIIDWDIDPVLSQTGEPVRLPGLRVSANYFSVFDVSPLLGRTFVRGEDETGRDNVAVLSYGLWRQGFGSDAGIIGELQSGGRDAPWVRVYQQHIEYRLVQRCRHLDAEPIQGHSENVARI